MGIVSLIIVGLLALAIDGVMLAAMICGRK